MKALRLVGLLVLFLGLSVFSAPCQAKPVQLLDYDAQTFFENYKLTCKRNAPVLDSAFPDSGLVYQGDTGLYEKYAFRTRNDIVIVLYENKSKCLSAVEIRDNNIPSEWNWERLVTPTVTLEVTLGLNKGERELLCRIYERKEFEGEGMMGFIDQSSLFIEAMLRYVHLRTTVVTTTVGRDSASFFYSADDEE